MNTNFYNLKGYVRVSGMLAYLAPLRTSLAALIFTTLTIVNCSGGGIFGKSSFSASTAPIGVPIGLVYQPSSTNLELSNQGLGLVSTGTSPIVSVASCASGYSVSNHAITSAVVNLYNGDQNCIVTLNSFVFQGSTYNDTNTGHVAFNTTATNGFATFARTGSGTAADLIKVYIGTQVSSPVTGSSTIVFNFTDISAGATNNVAQGSVSTAVPLTVSGRAAPNYYNASTNVGNTTFETGGGIVFTRYLSTNTNGSGNMSFTVACGLSVTGSAGAYSCPQPAVYSGQTNRDTTQTTDVQATEISYDQVPDANGVCIQTAPPTLTVAQANSIFSSPPNGTTIQTIPATDASGTTGASPGQIAAGAHDSWNNLVTNGGFDTPSILTGSGPIYTVGSGAYANGFQGLNNVFIIRRTDASANALSYIYQCVDLAAITQD